MKISALMTSLFLFYFSLDGYSQTKVGVGVIDISPPVGSPSAGCFEREGGMTGIHDPLLASAMVIDNGEKIIAFCSLDHMGLLRPAIEQIIQQVHSVPSLANCQVYISGSHTHSGCGGYIDLPGLGEIIAGPYDNNLVKLCVDGASNAIILAAKNVQPAKIGIGDGSVSGLTTYDGVYPKGLAAPSDLTIIKVTRLDDSPLAIFFNYSLYPDVLVYATEDFPLSLDVINLFSADIVGYVRTHIKSLIGNDVTPIFFNGAKGELLANVIYPTDRFKSCDVVGKKLAEEILNVWKRTSVDKEIEITTYQERYTFVPKETPSGFVLPIDAYETEMNLIVLNRTEGFLTIPAELSCSYDPVFKQKAKQLGFKHLTILDIVNDAHGYVYSPESWRLGPDEVEFSWGGEMYGQELEQKFERLLKKAISKHR